MPFVWVNVVVADGFDVIAVADANGPEPICDCVPGLALGEFQAACVTWFNLSA